MGRTRYPEIVDALAGDLGDREPGDRVPSEHEIAARFGVSRAAARAAVQELEDRLLVRRVRGSGTFVNHRIDYVISPRRAPSWHQTVSAAGAVPRSVVKEIREGTLDAELAARLERPAGSAASVLVRQYFINDLVAGWTTEWLPADICPPAADVAVRTVESVDLVLRQMAQVEPVRAWCRVGLEMPPPDVAAGLELDEPRHTWLVESMSRDAGTGQPVLASATWTRVEMVRMIVEMGEG
ncbi:MAG: GntR family transcriptional regulator [Streptosporangiales bacterium]|nr:GntR family transcriptional regulator [Streptosporangiales bacterium]